MGDVGVIVAVLAAFIFIEVSPVSHPSPKSCSGDGSLYPSDPCCYSDQHPACAVSDCFDLYLCIPSGRRNLKCSSRYYRAGKPCVTVLPEASSLMKPVCSTPHAHAIADVENPEDQGEVADDRCLFIDTFVVLTMTAARYSFFRRSGRDDEYRC